ncbi:UDP-glycosyltransferase 83A1 [Zea mays]|uniref:UDP-glycosyltransferase 83A1 n=1 Tax=Zea mays TaxID=4577 RepID=UPI0004DEB244|nr:UDP-glycosyltransferase 83A1 [Zea mays]|eukprot:XP_008646498.1 UDP-glycosyltransferase 83A1 [Zea mays]
MGTPTAAPHVMVLPFPAQGHVTPLMELSHRLVDRGFQVTFVSTEPVHALVLDAMRSSSPGPAGDGSAQLNGIRLASVPDGLADGADRRDLSRFLDALSLCVPGHVERLIRETKVEWLVGDVNMGVCFQAARKLGVRVAAVFPASAACLGTLFKVPQLIEEGYFCDKGLRLTHLSVQQINAGFPKRHGLFELAPGMPPMCPSQMPWSIDGDVAGQEVAYQLVTRNTQAARVHAEVIVCNSFRDAEAAALELFPSILPIGPLFADEELMRPVAQMLPEDTGCLPWLDARADGSVVYIAFGSFAIVNPRQFEELALGLERTGRPFLWVVRPGFTAGNELSKQAWFDEFQCRVAGRGMVVSWCPQQKVLAHRAVACFVSHCGWNSTMEGVRNGARFLCWPYFVDQFANRSYVCDIWRTGLAVSPGEDGVVTKEEVSSKVDRVAGDEGIADRARVLKDAACRCVAEGGSSHENFNRFVHLLRG